jgi:hypothetical protein
LEEISRKKEVFEVIEIKKAARGMLKVFDPGTSEFINQVAAYPDPWKPLVVSGTVLAFYQEDEIDISGLTTHMEKALMVSHCDINQSPLYEFGTGLSGTPTTPPTTRGWEIVILSDIPFDWNEWFLGLDQTLLSLRLPGVFTDMRFPTTKTLATDAILYGRFRNLQNNVDTIAGSALVNAESFFGDAKVTMSDRLYLYRFVKYEGTLAGSDRIGIPEFEIIINGHAGELNDLEQIMELRRSYLLQQTIS